MENPCALMNRQRKAVLVLTGKCNGNIAGRGSRMRFSLHGRRRGGGRRRQPCDSARWTCRGQAVCAIHENPIVVVQDERYGLANDAKGDPKDEVPHLVALETLLQIFSQINHGHLHPAASRHLSTTSHVSSSFCHDHSDLLLSSTLTSVCCYHCCTIAAATTTARGYSPAAATIPSSIWTTPH